MECEHLPPSQTPPKAVIVCWLSDGCDPPRALLAGTGLAAELALI